jgi:transposase
MAVADIGVTDDIAKLKALLGERDQEIAALDKIIQDITNRLGWAEEKYRAMELRYFGRRSERYSPEEDKQNRLFDEAEAHAGEDAPPVAERISVPAHERNKKGRKPTADGLPVREEIHELPAGDRLCPCCGEPRPEIGEVRTVEYDLVPAHVVKIVHRRKKYGPCVSICPRSSRSTTLPTGILPESSNG